VPATSTPSPRPSAAPPAAPAGQQVRSSDVRSSPLVRRIARENHIDLAGVPGTGLGGRISKNDILSFVQQHGPAQAGAVAAPARPGATPTAPPQPARPAVQPAAPAQRPAAPAVPSYAELPGDLVPMTPMRKKIAERMVQSRRTSAHVHTVFKVD